MQVAYQLQFEPDAYLAWETDQTEKHEYWNGEVYAMGGARREHVVVSGNVFAALKQRLRGKPCQPYIADMKLRVDEFNAFFYPDVMVSCHADDRKAEQFLSHPSVIIEVLSDSTAAYDRGDKFLAYRTLESLQEYLIIDVDSRRVECYRRAANQEWLLHDYFADDSCQFHSLGFEIPLAEFFEELD